MLFFRVTFMLSVVRTGLEMNVYLDVIDRSARIFLLNIEAKDLGGKSEYFFMDASIDMFVMFYPSN